MIKIGHKGANNCRRDFVISRSPIFKPGRPPRSFVWTLFGPYTRAAVDRPGTVHDLNQQLDIMWNVRAAENQLEVGVRAILDELMYAVVARRRSRPCSAATRSSCSAKPPKYVGLCGKQVRIVPSSTSTRLTTLSKTVAIAPLRERHQKRAALSTPPERLLPTVAR